MSDKRYEANIIRATAVEPANNLESTSAPGVWSIDEVVELQKKSKWPTVGNVATNVDSLFSTFLYNGTGSAQTITNNINLSGEGGLVWTKSRSMSSAGYHQLIDTVRGAGKFLASDLDQGESTDIQTISAFNSTGYAIGNDAQVNTNNETFVSWTFRKKAKFFDIQTWTGTGNARTISHNLGQVPGVIIVKRYSATEDWNMFHRSLGNTKYLQVNGTGAAGTSGTSGGQANLWNNTDPTSTEFSIGTHDRVNTNSQSYIAYIFAHNNNDGGFGPDGDEDIIKCGSYTHPNDTSTVSVNLGFEPQWILFKADQASVNWYIFDVMRGIVTGGLSGDGDAALFPNTAGAENVNTFGVDVTSTGFNVAGNNIASSGNNVIYMAIRRPQAAPTAASQVFAMDTLGGTSPTPPGFNSGFPVDMAFLKLITSSSDFLITSRLMQKKQLITNNENAEVTENGNRFDYQNGYYDFSSSASNYQAWMWKRARGYFDVVCYDGSGSNRTINHNLGAAPEMMWVKSRSNSGLGWMTYHIGTGATHYLMINSTAAAVDLDVIWNDTAPTSSVFSVGTGGSVNDSGKTYIAYLFTTLAGISKVGSYTGNGTGQNIECGFSSGARLILIKRTSGADSWFLWDSVRGIVSGNDPYLRLNLNSAQTTSTDRVDPYSGGFAVTGSDDGNNKNGDSYIFYAIA